MKNYTQLPRYIFLTRSSLLLHVLRDYRKIPHNKSVQDVFYIDQWIYKLHIFPLNLSIACQTILQ